MHPQDTSRASLVSRICERCGKPFTTRTAYVKRGGGRFCSKSCVNRVPIEERFWDHVDKNGPLWRGTPCWLWIGSCDPNDGYGLVSVNGRQQRAHRVSYTLAVGPIPRGRIICHGCNNPPCVSPFHVYAGTYQDNTRDAREAGRLASGDRHYYRLHPELIRRGEQVGSAVLTQQKVEELAHRYATTGVTQYELAAEYGVDQSAIADIIRGENWKHLQLERIASDGREGERIAQLREAMGLSRNALADRAGVSYHLIWHAETGGVPRNKYLDLIASALGATRRYLRAGQH